MKITSGTKLYRCGGCKLPTYVGGVPRTPPNTNLVTNQVEKTRRIPGDLSRESMACKSALPDSGANCSRPCGSNPKQSPISSKGTPASQQLLLSRWLLVTNGLHRNPISTDAKHSTSLAISYTSRHSHYLNHGTDNAQMRDK